MNGRFVRNHSAFVTAMIVVVSSTADLTVHAASEETHRDPSRRDPSHRDPRMDRIRDPRVNVIRDRIRVRIRDESQKQASRTAARRSLWLPAYTRSILRSNSPTYDAARQSQAIYESDIDAQIAALPSYSLIDETPSAESPDNLTPGAQIPAPAKTSTQKPGVSRVFSLSQGSVFVSHARPVKIQVGNNNVDIKAGSMALVIHTGSDTAIYNLSGDGRRSVVFSPGQAKRSYVIPLGGALFFSAADKFQDCILARHIKASNPVEAAQAENSLHIYSADFSYVSAMDRCRQFQECLRSPDSSKQAAANKLLKIAAASLALESYSENGRY